MKKLLALTLALVIALGLGAVAGYVWLDHAMKEARAAGESPVVVFTVPRGATGKALGRALVDAGIIEDARVWRFALVKRPGFAPKAGRHELRASMIIPDIMDTLEKAPLPEDEPFSMIEGWRVRDTDAALAGKGWIEPGAYVEATRHPEKFHAPFPLPADTLEGYLYPETYRVVPKPFDLHGLIQRQLDTFATRVWEPHKAGLQASGRSLHDVVKMASMLEREEPTPAQRPTVAGILWKRIDMGFPLGVDATSRYELAEWNDRKAFLQHLRDESDPYNTRKKPGLPPTPIGAPTEASMAAALRPEKNEFLYYLHDGDKKLHPSRNAEEHEALRKQFNVY